MSKKFFIRKNIGASVLIIMSILSVIITQSISAEGGGVDNIVVSFSFIEPVITEVNISNITYHKVTLQELPTIDDTGCPLLPVKPVRVLLPQKSILESINVTYKKNVSLGYRFNVELGSEKRNITREEQNESNVSINFDYTKSYPTELFRYVGTYNFRGYSYLSLVLYPVHYVWETGQLYYYEEMTVSITTHQNGSVNPLFRNCPVDKISLKHTMDDFSRMHSYSNLSLSSNSSLVNSSYSYDYVIITNETLKNSNGDYTFQDLADYKNSRYIETTIITVEEIMNDPYFMNTTNHLFNDTQARIRNFIIDAYKNWGIEFVLLGGDDNVIPARHFYYPFSKYEDEPSDLYYACLDGTFNYDEDYFWGEPTDGENSEDIDVVAEVYVGRACVNNSDEVSNFVSKTLWYENTFDPYTKEVLMAGEYCYGWSGNTLDKLNKSFPDGWSEYNITKLYDRDWEDPENDWPKEEIIKRINKGINIINHIGHSSSGYNMKMNRGDVDDDLTNDKYCFIYSEGCNAGYFPKDDCIAEHFTVKTDSGAFAGIWNARSGYIDRSDHFLWEFWDAIFNESIPEIGRANQDSKEDVFFNLAPERDILYGLNLYWCIWCVRW